jgi:hypothetical protein
MSVLKRPLVTAIALSIGLAARVLAADTGSVSGAVFDQNGNPVADAIVRIVGERMPAGRTVKTDSNGVYNIPLLLPGKYTVEVEKSDVGKSTRPVEVEVDKDTQVELVLGVQVKEEVTISAATPAVDLKSTEVNFNYQAEEIANLPLQRTYAGLFQLIPGVAENNSFAPNGGGSRQDNKYLLDGVDITNPGFGYLSSEVNELDIAEFNVKRGAVTAEFGRAIGFVTNAVTKSGTNDLRGIGRVELRPQSFVNDQTTLVNNTATKLPNTVDRYVGAFSVGGPIVQNRAFWYASGMTITQNTTDRQNNVGPVPDQKETQREIFGKVTLQPNNQMFLNGSFRYRPNKCTLCGVGTNDTPETATDTEGDNKVATVVWNWFPQSGTIIDVRYLHSEENSNTTARTVFPFKPTFDVNNLAAMGFFSDNSGTVAVNRGGASLKDNIANYGRDEIRGTYTRFFETGRAGHQLKAGLGYENGEENLTRNANGWGTITFVQNGTQIQAVYYPLQASQISPGRTYSLFLQDDITIGTRLVLNAGILFNRDEFAQKLASQNTFLTFGFGDEVQPRLGVNYNLRKGAGDKLYVNYGRYYAMDQKSSARSLAPARLFTNIALFDRTTGALLSDLPNANTTGKTIDPGLKPTYMDEVLVGYSTPIVTGWTADAFFDYRNSNDFIEDVPASLPATGPFHAAQLPDATRVYKAATVELNRRLANHWSMTASYSWSRLEGNFDLDYSTLPGVAAAVFNTSSAIQDGPGEFVEDPFRDGPLAQDRPHVLKVFGTYIPLEQLTLGGYVRAQSGTPWSARGRDWDNGFRRYLEPAGAHRNDAWTNIDLLASYRVPFGSRSARIEARVLNLFDTQTTLSVDTTKFNDGRVRPPASEFAFCGTDYACATTYFTSKQPTTIPNALFGTGNTWAPARRLYLTFVVDF